METNATNDREPEGGTGSARPSLPADREEDWAPRVSDAALLGVIDEFEAASLELVAWEFSVPPNELDAQWRRFVRQDLIVSVGIDPDTGETAYTLTGRGIALARAAS